MATVRPATRPQGKSASTTAANKPKAGKSGLRIRMYRVGFGDFFLVTAWTRDGPQHILIDCGVTAGKTGKGDIASLKTAVRHMAAETQNTLALIVITHRHADHIIGFSRCAAEFEKFKGRVGAIWMPCWEQEFPAVAKFQADLSSLALGLRAAALAGDRDDVNAEILGIAENATGVTQEGPGGGTNARSLELLKHQLGVTPTYHAKGDEPVLPKGLVDAGFAAQILGPPPITEFDFLKMMDLAKGVGQYLDATDGGRGRKVKLSPFAAEFVVGAEAYPTSAFREWAPRVKGTPPDQQQRYPAALEQAVKGSTPDALLMAARKLDNVLNNQSLVVLFTWHGKRLLFAGDAQAGNWLYWLYDADKPNKQPSGQDLAPEGRDILASLAFYKAGHHGSTNATPIPAVQAMGSGFVTMCSTQADTFGAEANDSEVPRIPLMNALEKKSLVVRSDHYAATIPGKMIPAVAGAPATPPRPGAGTIEVGDFYVDYML